MHRRYPALENLNLKSGKTMRQHAQDKGHGLENIRSMGTI